MRRLLLAMAVALPMVGASWEVVRSGPFEVYTDAGGRQAQTVAGDLEQYRHALSTLLGVEDLRTVWPLRVIVFSSAAEAKRHALSRPLALSRDAYLSVMHREERLPGAWLREATRLFLETALAGAPQEIEDGLVAVFGTLRIEGTRITLGTPPPPEERTPAWAMVHMLTVTPQYSGKFRVLMRNLPRTADNDPAFRNSLGKSEAEIRAEAAAYFQQGRFETMRVSGKALNPYRDLYVDPVRVEAVPVLLGDLHLARGDGERARAAYESALSDARQAAAAHEGLGLVALRQSRPQEAARHFREAAQAASGAAVALLELARLEEDSARAVAWLKEAARRNPRWPEPYRELARRSTDPAEQARAWGEAVKRAPRSLEDWEAMGQAYLEAKLYAEARQAWLGAERVAPTPAAAARCREQRLAVDRARIEAAQQAERDKRQAEADALERLKQEALARIRAKELETQAGETPRSPDVEVAQLDNLTAGRRMQALLQKVECRGKQFLLLVENRESGAAVRFAFDPARTLVVASTPMTFRCNQLLNNRRATVVYRPQEDARLGIIGEVGSIEVEER